MSERPSFWNCRLSKYLSQISGQLWETSFLIVPKISSLIDQRCRPSIITKCVSLSHAVCGCRPTLSSAATNTHTHTCSLSLSLSVCLLSFLTFPFHIKTLFPDFLIIIGNTDFTLFGCSHFIGSTNTKSVDRHQLSPTKISLRHKHSSLL